MAFERPKLQTIVDRIITDFETRITGAEEILRRSVLRIMGRVYAGACHLLYGYLDNMALQLFITTADSEHLETAGGEYGIVRTASVKATGNALATGTNAIIILEGSELQSATGEIYKVDADVTIAVGVATIELTAEEGGIDWNEEANAVLTFVSPIAGVDTEVTIDSDGLTGGTDEEADTAYRLRILTRKRQPPHGGAHFDYEAWAKEVSGVTRAWTIEQYHGVGTVGVVFVRDGDDSIIPDDSARVTVRTYIVSHTDPLTGVTVGCPVTAEPGLFMIESGLQSTDFSIAVYPYTAAVRAAIQTALEDLYLANGGPGNTIYLSQIVGAIASATGEERHSLTAPAADIATPTNKVPVVGTITWSELT